MDALGPIHPNWMELHSLIARGLRRLWRVFWMDLLLRIHPNRMDSSSLREHELVGRYDLSMRESQHRKAHAHTYPSHKGAGLGILRP